MLAVELSTLIWFIMSCNDDSPISFPTNASSFVASSTKLSIHISRLYIIPPSMSHRYIDVCLSNGKFGFVIYCSSVFSCRFIFKIRNPLIFVSPIYVHLVWEKLDSDYSTCLVCFTDFLHRFLRLLETGVLLIGLFETRS